MIDHKVLKIKKEHRPFVREQSVFADWKPDTSDRVDKCVTKDEMEMKLHKLMNDSEVKRIKHFFHQNYAIMKELRMGAIAFFNEPH